MTAHLRDTALGERLAQLPKGLSELVRRPPGGPRSWPDFSALAAQRWGEPSAAAA
jgi:hypothetical protein